MAEFCEPEKPIPRFEELTEADLAQQKEPTFTRIEIEELEQPKEELVHIHDDPGVYTISNYVTKEECEHMIKLAKPHLTRSVVSDDKGGYKSPGRTSMTAWIDHDQDEITTRLGEKIAKQVNIPIENAEKFQVVYYDEGNEYRGHCDSWDHDYSDKCLRCIKYGGQRMVTALVYLNNVEEGGSTKFTRLNKEVSPEMGKLLVFNNVYKDTTKKHPLSEHAGTPVLKGTKYIFNLWFRECSRSMLYEEYNPEYYTKMNNKLNLKEFKINELAETDELEKIHTTKSIYKSENFIDEENSKILIDECEFSTAKFPNCWIKNNTKTSLIKKLETMLKLEGRFFENMNIVKYIPGASHGPYFDGYDLTTENGKKYTQRLGQRLQTISISLSDDLTFKFDKIAKEIKLTTGTMIYYNNIVNTEQRDSLMNHTLINSSGKDQYLLNIYVRKYDEAKNVNPLVKSLVDETENIKMQLNEIPPKPPVEEEDYMDTYKTVLTKFENKEVTVNWPGFKSFKYFFKGKFDEFNEYVLNFKNLVDQGKGLRPEHLETTYNFDEFNPVVLENVVSDDMAELLKKYYRTTIEGGVFLFGDKQADRFKANNEPFSRFLHYEILPVIEKITQKKLRPTYTYLSSYIKNAELPTHTDRPDCAYTVSFLVNKSHDWPIYLHKVKQPVKNKGRYWVDPPAEECIELHSGSNGLIIFCGTDHIHFRKTFTGDFYDILLLHYRESHE